MGAVRKAKISEKKGASGQSVTWAAGEKIGRKEDRKRGFVPHGRMRHERLEKRQGKKGALGHGRMRQGD